MEGKHFPSPYGLPLKTAGSPPQWELGPGCGGRSVSANHCVRVFEAACGYLQDAHKVSASPSSHPAHSGWENPTKSLGTMYSDKQLQPPGLLTYATPRPLPPVKEEKPRVNLFGVLEHSKVLAHIGQGEDLANHECTQSKTHGQKTPEKTLSFHLR